MSVKVYESGDDEPNADKRFIKKEVEIRNLNSERLETVDAKKPIENDVNRSIDDTADKTLNTNKKDKLNDDEESNFSEGTEDKMDINSQNNND
jgi:hypothetical protein